MINNAEGAMGGDPQQFVISTTGIDYGTGSIADADTLGFKSNAFGMPFGQSVGWSDEPGLTPEPSLNFGTGMIDNYVPWLQEVTTAGGTMVQVTTDSHDAIWFEENSGGTFSAQYFYQDSLQLSGGVFILTDSTGDVIRFSSTGQFQSLTSPYGDVTGGGGSLVTNDGHVLQATYSGGLLSTIESSAENSSGTLETQIYAYSYNSNNTVSSVVWEQQIGTATPTIVRQAVYTYYASGATYGNAGDLEMEQVEDGSGNVLDTTYFRYYTSSDEVDGTYIGYADGLQYVLGPQAYARLAAVTDPLTASNATVAPYANQGKRPVECVWQAF